MATVDGVPTAPDKYGIIQGNGDLVDKMAGDGANNQLQGHADFNQYYGGAGNDAFIMTAKFGQVTQEPSKDYGTLAAYITDFHGAGGPGTGEQDFVKFSGFTGVTTSDLKLIGSMENHTANAPDAVIYYYSVYDAAKEGYFNIAVNSVNGQKLAAGDFNFY